MLIKALFVLDILTKNELFNDKNYTKKLYTKL